VARACHTCCTRETVQVALTALSKLWCGHQFDTSLAIDHRRGLGKWLPILTTPPKAIEWQIQAQARLLKGPLFFASSLFVKKPGGIPSDQLLSLLLR
jgi:hypothetical protein